MTDIGVIRIRDKDDPEKRTAVTGVGELFVTADVFDLFNKIYAQLKMLNNQFAEATGNELEENDFLED